MSAIDILGLVAGTLTTLSFLPQVMQIWRTRSSQDISPLWILGFGMGITLWLIYGLLLGALPVILANAITLFLLGIILYFKLKFG
ncbi:MAG: SemiSWEET transporter [Leptolyngbyaceae cyanobacterium bins.59]|nr:SemiSWEET transporter [Leptolyngbyaceae cyanobacterium bins.59]